MHEVGVLAERHGGALAVDLGRRGDDDELLLLVRVLEHDLGAVHVGLDRAHRRFDDQLHADGGREVEDDVAAIDELGQQRLVRDRVDRCSRNPGAALEVRDVVDRPGRQVVEDEHLVAAVEQRVGQVRSDEAGAAGEQCFHRRQSSQTMALGRRASAACPSARACRSALGERASGVEQPPSRLLDHTGARRAPRRLRRRRRAPTMTPASTNGLRLFGSPIDQRRHAERPARRSRPSSSRSRCRRAAASSAREIRGRRRDRDVRRRPARRGVDSGVSAGCGLTTSCTSGTRAHARRRAPPGARAPR